jgi:hypothetical protein
LGLDQLDVEFNALTPAQKLRLAKALRELHTFGDAWDLTNLLSHHIADARINGWNKWGTGKGVDTVTVDGQVHWAPAVNYILWGRINRLLYDNKIGQSTISLTSILDSAMAIARPGYTPQLESHSLDWTVKSAEMWRSVKSKVDEGDVNGPLAWVMVGWSGDWRWASKAVLSKPGIRYIPCPVEFVGGLHWRLAPEPFSLDRYRGSGGKGMIDFQGAPELP